MIRDSKKIYVVSSISDNDSFLLGAFYSKERALEFLIKVTSRYDYQSMRWTSVTSGGIEYMTTYIDVFDKKQDCDRRDSKYPIDNMELMDTLKLEEVELS